jgi:hypothetical protein
MKAQKLERELEDLAILFDIPKEDSSLLAVQNKIDTMRILHRKEQRQSADRLRKCLEGTTVTFQNRREG